MANYEYLYDKGKNVTDVNHFSNKPLSFRIIDNGTILSHKQLPDTCGFCGILDVNGNAVKSSALTTGTADVYTPNEVKEDPQTVIYLGVFVHIWGHCLTDDIKRLWFLRSEVYKKYFKKYPIVYTPMWLGIIPPFARLLEILEVDISKLIPILTPTKFQNVLIPDESLFNVTESDDVSHKYYTKEFEESVEIIKSFARKNNQSLHQKKIYYFHGRNEWGENRVAEYFKSKGYEIIHPEQLPFDEQLNVLINCENFASSLGSISHNTMFMNPNTNALFIPRLAGGASNEYQKLLDQMSKINSTYIDTTFSTFDAVNGPYCYIISKQLREFFGDNADSYTDEDFITFLLYIKHALTHGINFNGKSAEGYGETYTDFFLQLKQRKDLMQEYGVMME